MLRENLNIHSNAYPWADVHRLSGVSTESLGGADLLHDG